MFEYHILGQPPRHFQNTKNTHLKKPESLRNCLRKMLVTNLVAIDLLTNAYTSHNITLYVVHIFTN